MEVTDENNDSKKKVSYQSIEIFKKYIDSALIVLFLSASIFTLSYGYNGGYNYYYGIPLYLTTTSPVGIMINIPYISQIIISLLSIAVIYILTRLVMSFKPKNNKKEKHTNRNILIYFIFVSIMSIISIILFKLVLLIIFSVIYLILTLIIILYIRMKNRIVNISHKIENEGINSEKEAEEIMKEIGVIDKRIDILNSIPNKSLTLYICISIIFTISLLFSLAFVFGNKTAKDQKDYYFVDNDKIAVSLYENYIVAVNANKDQVTGQYKCGGKYYLIPMDNIEMILVNTGEIASEISLEEIEINLKFK